MYYTGFARPLVLTAYQKSLEFQWWLLSNYTYITYMCCKFVAISQSTFVIFYRASFFFARNPVVLITQMSWVFNYLQALVT